MRIITGVDMVSNRGVFLSDTLVPGDWVIYRKTKWSSNPGPRAENIAPASNGDLHTYTVDKFWIVLEIHDCGEVVVATRRGKQHIISADAPSLRKPNWFERWRYGSRFREVESQFNREAG